jgi:hypothetical protein
VTPEADAQKALTKNPLGATGKTVALNVERLRKEQNLTFAALSSRLSEIGRQIPPLGLRKIVAETRRVDSDDLVALAVVLSVSPPALLMPMGVERSDLVSTTATEGEVAAELLWKWLKGEAPPPGSGLTMMEFGARAWPQWEHDEFEDLTNQLRQQGAKGLGDD